MTAVIATSASMMVYGTLSFDSKSSSLLLLLLVSLSLSKTYGVVSNVKDELGSSPRKDDDDEKKAEDDERKVKESRELKLFDCVLCANSTIGIVSQKIDTFSFHNSVVSPFSVFTVDFLCFIDFSVSGNGTYRFSFHTFLLFRLFLLFH